MIIFNVFYLDTIQEEVEYASNYSSDEMANENKNVVLLKKNKFSK